MAHIQSVTINSKTFAIYERSHDNTFVLTINGRWFEEADNFSVVYNDYNNLAGAENRRFHGWR